MLHELILSLLCPNSKFLEEQAESLELNSFLHPSEKRLLRNILNVAKDFATIQKFSESVTENVGETENAEGYGMYIKAFADGIEKELVPYHRGITCIQEKAFSNPSVTLSELQCFAMKHYTSLRSYSSLINNIEDRHLRGGQVLQLIYESLTCGDEHIKHSLNRILQRCHIAFFKQLSSWLFYGHSHDRYNEFFIQPLEQKETNNSDSVSVRIPVNTIAAFQFFVEFNTASNIKKHQIKISLVPSYISYSLAQKILFLGETILILYSQYSKKNEKADDVLVNSIYNGKEKEYIKNVTELEEGIPLKPYHLEKSIDGMRSSVMEYLWNIAISESDLYGQMKLLKDFYLLSQGELFTEFLRKCGDVLYKPLVNTTGRVLNYSLQQAVRSIGIIDDISLDKFEFLVPDECSVKEGSNVFHCLKLTYKAEWPLQLFFTPEVLHNYNAMFLFLLRIKKIQIDLHKIWLSAVKQKEEKCWKVAWQLRTGLIFLIEHLQYYLQVDVLETEFSALMKAANEIRDFEKLQQMHLIFLAKILTHSFISYIQLPTQKSSTTGTHDLEKQPKMRTHPVNACLMNIFSICENYISLMALEESPDLDIKLQSLLESFDQKLSVLIMNMSELNSRNTNYKHLNQFLLRLDFNNWFTNKFDLSKCV